MMFNLANSFDAFSLVVSNLTWQSVVDVLAVATLIYLALVFIRETRSFFIPTTLGALLVLSYIADKLNLGLTRQLFQPLLTFFVIVLMVVFQKEVRRFFEWFSLRGRHLALARKMSLSSEAAAEIVDAVVNMAKKKIGAIIVLPGDHPLEGLTEGGFILDGRVSVPVILSIFDPTSPGHDGAMVVDDNRIKRFGVHLPLAQNFSQLNKVGTRHRAAVGITEMTDALAVVVSEERGTISLARSGNLEVMKNPDDLEQIIASFFKKSITIENRQWNYLLSQNFWTKVVAVVIASLLWFFFVFQVGTVNQELNIPIEVRFSDRKFVVTQVEPKEAQIVLSGSYRDLSSNEIQRLKVELEISSSSPGTKDIKISADNLNLPKYATLVSINPEEVSVTIEAVTP